MIGQTKNYYLPLVELVPSLDPPACFYDKFGGLPWGLAAARWPTCAHCGCRMALLAQLAHGLPRLDLRHDGRVLYVLQCPQWHINGCDAFDSTSGANACLILEPDEIVQRVEANDLDVRLAYLESRIVSWQKHSEGLGQELELAYFDVKKWHDVPIQAHFMLCGTTKAGGIPFWGNVGPSDVPIGDWHFALQISDDHYFAGDWTEQIVRLLAEREPFPSEMGRAGAGPISGQISRREEGMFSLAHRNRFAGFLAGSATDLR